jgi:hypothetical protein
MIGLRGILSDPAGGLVDAMGRPVSRVLPLVSVVCVVLALAGWAIEGDSGKFFGEGKPGTLLSVLLLGLSSYASMKRARGGLPWRVRMGWVVFGATLALAALDDMFKGHESADKVLNGWLGLDPEGIAGKLDDALVLLYLVPAGCVLLWSWGSYAFEERAMFWRLAISGVWFFLMVAFDVIDRDDLQWLEESSKVISGAFIFSAIVGTPIDGRGQLVGAVEA